MANGSKAASFARWLYARVLPETAELYARSRCDVESTVQPVRAARVFSSTVSAR
jgi:hypothetical protein